MQDTLFLMWRCVAIRLTSTSLYVCVAVVKHTGSVTLLQPAVGSAGVSVCSIHITVILHTVIIVASRITVDLVFTPISWNLIAQCLTVTGGGSVGECGRLSQP